MSRDTKSEHNPYWRQAMSYWEMAASFVLRGALDADLFLDSSVEGILIYAKFHHCHAETEKETREPLYGEDGGTDCEVSGGKGPI